MLREQNSNTITVGAGDLIGASPLVSALFHDEPTIEAMNALGLDVSGVGNHEFDEGVDRAPAHAVRGLPPGRRLPGRRRLRRRGVPVPRRERLLRRAPTETIFPPYEVEKIDNAKIAFIGLTLEGTPTIVTPSASPASSSGPRSRPSTRSSSKLRNEQGVKAFVVLVHQGGLQNPPRRCSRARTSRMRSRTSTSA